MLNVRVQAASAVEPRRQLAKTEGLEGTVNIGETSSLERAKAA